MSYGLIAYLLPISGEHERLLRSRYPYLNPLGRAFPPGFGVVRHLALQVLMDSTLARYF